MQQGYSVFSVRKYVTFIIGCFSNPLLLYHSLTTLKTTHKDLPDPGSTLRFMIVENTNFSLLMTELPSSIKINP